MDNILLKQITQALGANDTPTAWVYLVSTHLSYT